MFFDKMCQLCAEPVFDKLVAGDLIQLFKRTY